MVTSVETYRAAFVMLEHWGKGAHAEAVRKLQVAQAIGDAQGHPWRSPSAADSTRFACR
jgi:hypothetical protein